VGHTARALEEAGISTVAIFIRAFRHHAANLKLPRTLITPHLMGRTVGPPGEVGRQRRVVQAALELLETATAPGTIVEFDDARGA
jgi:hypothetical protein